MESPDDAAGRHATTSTRTTAPGAPARSSSPPARTATPGTRRARARRRPRGHQQPVPQPGRLEPRRRPGRGRLLLRRADRRRAGHGRAATSSSRSAGTPGCPAATAAWTSSGGSRPPAGSPARSTRCPIPSLPAASPHFSWSAAARASDDDADVDLAALQRRGVRLTGRLQGLDGRTRDVRRRLADDIADADRRMHALPRLSRPVRRSRGGLTGEVLADAPARPGQRLGAPHLTGPARRRHPDGRPRHRLPPGQRLGATSRSRPRRHHPPVPRGDRRARGLRRRAALPAPPRLRVHRRRPPRRARGRGPPDHRRPAGNRTAWGSSTCEETRMNEYDVVIVGGRVAGASTALLLARAGLRVGALRAVTAGLRHALDPCAHARRRPAALPVGGAPRAASRAGTPAIRSTTFHYGDGRTTARCRSGRAPGVDALYAPRRHLLDRVLVEAAADVGGRRPSRQHGRGAAPRRRRRRPRRPRQRAAMRRGPGPGRPHGRRRRHRLRSSHARSDAPSYCRARAASAVLYRYVDRTCRRRATSGATATRVGAGLIPTNDGETCVFVSTTPQRMRHLRRGGAEAAFDSLLAAPHRAIRDAVRAGGTQGRLHGWRGMPGLRPAPVRAGLGPRRRRRLLQGPDHHPWHHRRAPRRRAAGGRRARGCPPVRRPSVALAAVREHPGPAVESPGRGDRGGLPRTTGPRTRSRRCCAGSAAR